MKTSGTFQSTLLLLVALSGASAFAPSPLASTRRPASSLQAHKGFQNAVASAVIASTLAFTPLMAPQSACAYDDSDYASETVTTVVDALKNAGTNAPDVFKTYEGIAGIITEGRGVGGSINYEGVQLNRGYVADEDTAIYNPGLTLLTESEKERIVEAVINARKTGVAANTWTSDNQVGYEFLKEKLDPLRMVELRGYLGVLPFYGAAVYLGVLAVQQNARGIFQPAYLVGAGLVFLPAIALVALGPL